MKQPKISLSDKSISFKEFTKQFGDYFVDSHEPRRQKAIETAYEQATGRKVKQTGNETAGTKNISDKVKSNDTGSIASATAGKSEA